MFHSDDYKIIQIVNLPGQFMAQFSDREDEMEVVCFALIDCDEEKRKPAYQVLVPMVLFENDLDGLQIASTFGNYTGLRKIKV